MKKVERNEILPLGEYEQIRERFRARVIDEKKSRRVKLGDKISVVFENHDTALFQIQEMLRTERITREEAVLHEIETYNDLVPGDRELSCTAMIEIVDDQERERFLVAAKGIEKCFHVSVARERYPGRVAQERLLEDRASAVIYVKFALSEAATRALLAGESVTLAVEHAAYSASVLLGDAVQKSLAGDLA